MYITSYDAAIPNIVGYAPSLKSATEFIKWAEIVADTLSIVYNNDDYDSITSDLYESAKEAQEWLDNDGEDEYSLNKQRG